MSDNGPYILFYAVAAVFVAASLASRRLPIGRTLRMASAWIGIFAVAFVLFAFRDDFAGFAQRLKSEALGTPLVDGATVRIPMAEDGHFWVRGELNGHGVRFMVDSGASITTVGVAAARAAGIETGRMRAVVSTANGQVLVSLARADRLQVGSIVREGLAIHVSDRDEVNVLGMNFLSSLQRWSVEGSSLVLVS